MALLGADGVLERPPAAASPLNDRRTEQVLERMLDQSRRPANGGPRGSGGNDPHAYAQFGFSIQPDQGELIYLLCRALNARRVVDFATSVGFSALYLAAAVRDNGGGRVIGAEIVPAKIATARDNLAAAGLEELVEIRPGDARQTLRDLGGPVDFALIDGWPGEDEPSLALEVMRVLAPQLRRGALVVYDNAEADYLAFVRDPANGFRSMSLPLKGGTELSVKAP
jgi:predicted O-methyltransferase YrrM